MVRAGWIYTVLVGYHLPKLCEKERKKEGGVGGEENKQEENCGEGEKKEKKGMMERYVIKSVTIL